MGKNLGDVTTDQSSEGPEERVRGWEGPERGGLNPGEARCEKAEGGDGWALPGEREPQGGPAGEGVGDQEDHGRRVSGSQVPGPRTTGTGVGEAEG